MYNGAGGIELGAVGASILVALLELLVDKNVLTRADVRGILADARQSLEPASSSMSIARAIAIIEKDILPKFPSKSG